MIKAIVYTSNTGTTEQYAKLLSEQLKLPFYPLDKCTVAAGEEIIYLGWVMASSIKGCKKAMKKYNVKALCGVCMGATGSQLEELRKRNEVSDSISLFSLQGGFDKTKLRGMYKLMMSLIEKTVAKGIENKSDRTSEETDMLDMLKNGANRVSVENLSELLDWYNSTQI